jgi:hypothetical protein
MSSLSVLVTLLFTTPVQAESFHRCVCLGDRGQVVCGAADFGPDPDGANVPGFPSAELNAEKMCRELRPELETLSCHCTAD